MVSFALAVATILAISRTRAAPSWRASGRPRAQTPRSPARAGSSAVSSGITSTSPPPISATASANSSWKRKVPRSSISLATATFIGRVISAARDADLHDDAGRAHHGEAPASAAALPEASNITSKEPLSAPYRASASFSLTFTVASAPTASRRQAAHPPHRSRRSPARPPPRRDHGERADRPRAGDEHALAEQRPARLTACRHTAKGSAKAACAADIAARHRHRLRSSHTSMSRKPPWTWGKRIALP